MEKKYKVYIGVLTYWKIARKFTVCQSYTNVLQITWQTDMFNKSEFYRCEDFEKLFFNQ